MSSFFWNKPHSKTSLLLVEDDPIDAHIFMRLLRKSIQASIEVDHVLTCHEAIDCLRAKSYDLVVLDFNLPDARGLETVTMVQPYAPLSTFIALTGIGDHETSLKAATMGVEEFISKIDLTTEKLERALCYTLERKKERERLIFMAYNDPLTGLANSSRFRNTLKKVLNRAQIGKTYTGLLHLDVNYFRSINETLGYEIGDFVLETIAHRLEDCLRPGDLAARIGGDEFTAIVENISYEDLFHISQQLVEVCRKPITFGKKTVHMSISLGAVMTRDHKESPQVLIDRAVQAFRQAKKRNRNSFFIAEQTCAFDMFNWQHDEILEALEKEQFTLVYQTQIDTETNQCVGVEALLRWHHPQHGLLEPSAFLPYLKRSGLIVPVGAWVIQESCRQMRLWRDHAINIDVICVNIASGQIQSKLIDTVKEALEQHGLEPECLEIEMTENTFLHAHQNASYVLQKLRAFGVRIALDDVGTGLSSLHHLAASSPHRIKIDGSFVQKCHTETNNAVITAIINLAHSLGIDVVGEGVEESAQAAFLRSKGCRVVQGFLYSQPVASNDVAYTNKNAA